MSDFKNDNYNSTHPDQQKLVFDNVYGELEFYKKKCDVLEKDLFKSQTQIKKLEISLKKLQDLNALNGKNNNNTSISFLLPSEFKTHWENFAKNLILEAYDCLYDDYLFLSYVTHDTLQIAYQQTREYMNEKINQVLKVLNVNIDLKEKSSDNEVEKFFSRFKVIFQDYYSSIFIFNEDYNNKIKMSLLREVKAYSFITSEKHAEKLEDFESDLGKNSFKNLTQSLFKMCIFMILHDPLLTFNIKNHKEREITYMYYNKNEMMNIEGFGTEQTPCAIIVPPPILRKSFPYMGIKPAVYCIQKSEANDKIIAECEKNKQLQPRNASGDFSTTINNLSAINPSSPKKLNSNKSASFGDCQGFNNATPIKGESMSANYHSNTEKKRENQITFASNKSKRTNSEDFREDGKFVSTNGNVILTQEQDKNNKEDKKRCYDHPLKMKNQKTEELPNNQEYKSSFVGSFVNNPNININSPVGKPAYKSNTMAYKTKNSRSSSIGESHDNSIDSKIFVNHLHLQNLNNINSNLTNLQNYTKTSRVFGNKNPLETEGNNTNTIPMRYIPTGNTLNTENGFSMIRSKNNKQIYISDNVKRETANGSMEEKIYDVNKINYPFKDDYTRVKNDGGDHFKKLDLKYKEDGNINQYFNNKHFSNNYEKSTGVKIENTDTKRKQLNNFINYNNNYGGGYSESGNNYTNLNRKLTNHTELTNNKSNNTSNIGRTASKELKAESRIFASTPNDFIDSFNGDKPKNESFVNYVDTNSNLKTNSFSTHTDHHIENNAFNDMKYNGPKKDNFTIRISKMKEKDFDMTPSNNKIRTNIDIKSQIGKYYNKVVSGGASGNYNANTSGGGNISNSPRSMNTYSTTSDKSSKEKKYYMESASMAKSIGNNRNIYFNNFQQIISKK